MGATRPASGIKEKAHTLLNKDSQTALITCLSVSLRFNAGRVALIRTCVFSDFVNASPSRRNSLIFNMRHSMVQKVMKSGNSQIQLWKERRTPCKALLTSSLFAPLYSAYWKSTSYVIKLGDAGWRKQRSEPCFALLRAVRPCTAYREDIST